MWIEWSKRESQQTSSEWFKLSTERWLCEPHVTSGTWNDYEKEKKSFEIYFKYIHIVSFLSIHIIWINAFTSVFFFILVQFATAWQNSRWLDFIQISNREWIVLEARICFTYSNELHHIHNYLTLPSIHCVCVYVLCAASLAAQEVNSPGFNDAIRHLFCFLLQHHCSVVHTKRRCAAQLFILKIDFIASNDAGMFKKILKRKCVHTHSLFSFWRIEGNFCAKEWDFFLRQFDNFSTGF